MTNVLVIEPFYGGSHKQLIDLMLCNIPQLENCTLVTLTAKKWHWRARVSALQIFNKIPYNKDFKVLFCSSVLNLTEICGLRPDLANIPKKIIYFHENQLTYPVQSVKKRDIQYGYNQITSCITADVILFNSNFNKNSFISSINSFLNIIPDNKIRGLEKEIDQKSDVLYFPIDLKVLDNIDVFSDNKICHILWPHRWDHDKNPDVFFQALFELSAEGVPFRLSVLGEESSEVPPVMLEARQRLKGEIVHMNFVPTKSDYVRIVCNADVVVSTALHEFYGVAMLEASLCGCIVVVPRRLSYPEVFGDAEMQREERAIFYNTDGQLKKTLRRLCLRHNRGYRLDNPLGNRQYLERFLLNEDSLARLRSVFEI